ncbi:MAG: ATP synthase F1 subunit delta [Planctomycetes bacterium]|nr:ATP synthase F1 subunit delta [Planctomycetota bacterium]
MATPATVPGVYAQSLLDVASERGTRAAVVESCRELAGALAPAALAALDDPRIGKVKAKDALRSALAGQPREILDLLLLLVDRNRLAEAPAILKEAVKRAEVADGIVRIKVVSARPLSDELSQRLAASVGGKAEVTVAVEPALIGGATVRVGDRLVDASVKRQLREMHNRMINAPVSDALWAKE